MAAIWSFPTRIHFGEGIVESAGAEAKSLGGTHALVVSDGGVGDAGAMDAVVKSLESQGLGCDQFIEITSNPKEREIRQAAKLCSASGADVVVAVGGGSVIDSAKLARLLSLTELDLSGQGPLIAAPLEQPPPPLIAISTTAGTGSEVSSAAILASKDGRRTMVSDDQLMPDLALLDPILTMTMPPELTAASGFDALAHCIEGYCASGDHPMADAIALEGLKLAAKYLPKVVAEEDDVTSRAAMMKAAMMGGVAMQKGLGVCHALADALCAHFELHHGRAAALCLPAVLDFNRSAVPTRIARIARFLNVRGDDEETLAFECSGALRALRKKVGLPDSLSELAMPESSLPEVARTAFGNPAHSSNPRTCSEDDMLAMYRASF